MRELRNCPFCGGEVTYARLTHLFWHVYCKECTLEMTAESRRELTERWNKRKADELVSELNVTFGADTDVCFISGYTTAVMKVKELLK